MKKILIISPHFPPSNLTAVHRARFFANHLPAFGWEPIILTVDEKYYEEALDWNLYKLLPEELRIEKVKAMRVTQPRIIGDIGLRAFFSMYHKAKKLIRDEKIDFLCITIPSFYGALWGRWLHASTGIPYGIDYIDPWVHEFPGSEKIFSRHWLATKVSEILEPLAVKKASLISGVAASYYEGVIDRNPNLRGKCKFIAIPYGSERSDHKAVQEMDIHPYLFSKEAGKIKLVYAGAMLPKAYGPLEQVFAAMQENKKEFSNVEFHFIGTGKSPNDKEGFNIRPLAERYSLWQSNVYEYPARIPYLDVLVHLNEADSVFILGSTEPHYTPSKVYQAVLSEKPILAILHKESTGVEVIRNSHAGVVLDISGEEDLPKIHQTFNKLFKEYLEFMKGYNYQMVDQSPFKEYSAEKITETLSKVLNSVI